jgi:hypothetical protein
MTFLSSQLRESAPYLQDEGWEQTAQLLLAAAAEIECLQTQLLETKPIDTAQKVLPFDPHCVQPFNSSAALISGQPLTDEALAFVKTRKVA